MILFKGDNSVTVEVPEYDPETAVTHNLSFKFKEPLPDTLLLLK